MAVGDDDTANAPLVDRRALELYLLRDSADATHNIKVIAPSGDTWYRGETPSVDLGDVEFQRASILRNADDSGYMIRLMLRNKRVQDVGAWSAANLGRHVGVFIGGACQSEVKINSRLSRSLCVGAFPTMDDAEAACALIRAGGDTARFGEALRQLQRGRSDAEVEASRREKRSPETIAPPVAFSLYSVRAERDDEHPTRAGVFRGAAWYRANEPGLDSTQCRSIRHFGARPMDDRVETFVRREELSGVSRWLSDNAGRLCGFFEDGNLVDVVILPNAIDETLSRLGLNPGPNASQPTSQPSMTIDVKTSGVMAEIWPYGSMSVVALSDVRDIDHATPLQDGDGAIWFGSASDHVNLDADGGIDALVSASPDGAFRVCVRVHAGARNQLSDFCSKHANEQVGVVSLDLPLIVLRLGAQSPDAIELASFSNWKAAGRLRDLLRNELPRPNTILSDEQAKARILDWYSARGERAPYVDEQTEIVNVSFPLEDIWRRLNAQVVVRGMQGYVICGNEVARLGESMGGLGLQDTCVADLDADGEPELIFVTSWGSGIHRSQVGVWCNAWPAPRVRMAALSHVGGPDYELRRLSDQHVGVFLGEMRVGSVRLRPTNNGPEPEIVLDSYIPPAVRPSLVEFGVPGKTDGATPLNETSAKSPASPEPR